MLKERVDNTTKQLKFDSEKESLLWMTPVSDNSEVKT